MWHVGFVSKRTEYHVSFAKYVSQHDIIPCGIHANDTLDVIFRFQNGFRLENQSSLPWVSPLRTAEYHRHVNFDRLLLNNKNCLTASLHRAHLRTITRNSWPFRRYSYDEQKSNDVRYRSFSLPMHKANDSAVRHTSLPFILSIRENIVVVCPLTHCGVHNL